MKKSIAIFGCSLFQDIKYKDGRYHPTQMQTVIQLTNQYKIDNYSLEGMTTSRAKRLIASLPMKKLYENCILSLGEAELDYPEAFEKNLIEIISMLQKKCVRPLLVSLPKEMMSNEKAVLIQDILDKVAVEKNVDYIYEGETTKLVSYKVLENQGFTDAILNLC